MKYKIIFSKTAEDDLREIALYIVEHSNNVDLAINFVNGIRETCKILEDFPECGSVPQDRILVCNGYRFLVYGNYLVFYVHKVEDDSVFILSVVNSKQDYLRVIKRFI
ncbi:MAG: type II toxin-antitoxin system RelE/ParE family toxin [Clostridiales bacterium]|nr:type II toxin-antitoxin system RelE/ParE family toxin [Clostridiales bacterium]